MIVRCLFVSLIVLAVPTSAPADAGDVEEVRACMRSNLPEVSSVQTISAARRTAPERKDAARRRRARPLMRVCEGRDAAGRAVGTGFAAPVRAMAQAAAAAMRLRPAAATPLPHMPSAPINTVSLITAPTTAPTVFQP